jgi:hypothetical protein
VQAEFDDLGILNARESWREGTARIERYSDDSDRRRVLEDIIEALIYELEKRIGQTFSTAQLATEWEQSDSWCMPIVQDVGAENPWAWDLSPVQGAAFHRFERRAIDYTP